MILNQKREYHLLSLSCDGSISCSDLIVRIPDTYVGPLARPRFLAGPALEARRRQMAPIHTFA